MKIAFLLTLLLLHSAQAESRKWTDASGTPSFYGELIEYKNGMVTISKGEGQEYNIAIENLHASDQKWLRAKVEEERLQKIKNQPAFDELRFGDNRGQVQSKIRTSQIIEGKSDLGMFDGLGTLNGIYQTKNKIGGLKFSLNFVFQDKLLRLIELESDTVTPAEYTKTLNNSWSELSTLLSQMYGTPGNAAPYPDLARLSSGRTAYTHRWSCPNGAEVIMGPRFLNNDNQYQLMVQIREAQ